MLVSVMILQIYFIRLYSFLIKSFASVGNAIMNVLFSPEERTNFCYVSHFCLFSSGQLSKQTVKLFFCCG